MKQRMLTASLITVLAIGCGLIASCFLHASMVVISFFILICSLVVLHKFNDFFNLRSLSIPGFFYLVFLAFLFIPAHFVFLNVSDPYRNTYLIAVSSVLLTFPLGVIFASCFFKYKPSESRIYSSTEVSKQEGDARLEPIFLIFLVAAIGFVGLYISEVETIPILYAFSHAGSSLELALVREESFALLDSRFIYIYYWMKVLFFPFLAAFSYGMYSMYKKKRWLLYLVVTLLLGTFYMSLTIERAPVAIFYVFVFLFIFLFHRGRFKKKYFLPALIAIAWFPVLINFLRTGLEFSGGALSTLLYGIVRRFFYKGAYGLYEYFTVFPARHDFLYGQGIRPLAILTGQDYFNISNYVLNLLHPSSVGSSGTQSTSFIGYYYADFGMAGVLLSSFALGVLLQSLQIYCVRREKNLLNFVVYAWLVFIVWRVGAITALLWSHGVLIVLFSPWLFKLLGDLFNPRKNNA